MWSQRFGDVGVDSGHSVTTDSAGNVVLVGGFSGEVDFGGEPLTSKGGRDIFVVKLDMSGGHLWSKAFGGADDQYGVSVMTDRAGNIVLTGYFYGTVDFGGELLTSEGLMDILVAKLDPSGVRVWSKRFGDAASQYGSGVTTDSVGNVLLTGFFAGTVDLVEREPLTSAGGYDFLVAKLAP